MRTVASGWKKADTDTIDLPAVGEGEKPTKALLVIWTRDIYHEWELMTCEKPFEHQGGHEGAKRKVYSLLNTISEKKIYTQKDENQQPPASHYSNGLPELDLSFEEVMSAAELPSETIK